MSFEDLESGRPLTFNGRQHRQDPSQAVAAGVFQINTAVNSYQRLVNSLGTPKDTFELRQKMCVISLSFFFLPPAPSFVFLLFVLQLFGKTPTSTEFKCPFYK